MVFHPMEPVIGRSNTLIGENRWSLGSMHLSEQITGPIPADALATWKEKDLTFCIRPRSAPIFDPPADGDSRIGKYNEMGTGFAAWSLSKTVVCEVWAWIEGMPIEEERLNFVKKNAPSVPVPDIVLNWVDRSWNREFIVRKHPEGVNMEETWLNLSVDQIRGIANQVAEHSATLAKLTSPQVENGLGQGMVCDPFLFGERDADLPIPSWKPYILPVMSADVVRVMLAAQVRPNTEIPYWGKEFVFTHWGLFAACIYITTPTLGGDVPRVTCINGWRHSGYLPRWWLATKLENYPMWAIEKDVPGKYGWVRSLDKAVEEAGFQREAEFFHRMQRWCILQNPGEDLAVVTKKEIWDKGW